ncbi:MAG: AAA family ATPase [Gammaproteobacteria bacterium]|nr:MAG: AAA family ATPase [Gammaproteobacteria bacterium]
MNGDTTRLRLAENQHDGESSPSVTVAASLAAFGENRDTRFFFPAGSAGATLEALRDLVAEAETGLAVVTGDPGCGKTMLRSELHRRLTEDGCRCATLENGWLDFDGIVLELISQLENRRIEVSEYSDRYSRVAALKQALLRHVVRPNRRFAILIDEAQQLEESALEGIRSLTNINAERQNYMTPVLIGQPDLAQRVASRPEISSRARIVGQLESLSEKETEAYVRHRIGVATGGSDIPFTREALAILHEVSGGIPRVVNQQCKLALNACQALGRKIVDANILRDSAGKLDDGGSWPDSCLLSG